MYSYPNSENQNVLNEAGYPWASESLKRPSDFGYYGDLDLFNTWGLVFCLEHRDSNVLDQSNSASIQKMIQESGLQDSFSVCHFNHWAVGWIDQLAAELIKDGKPNLPVLEFMQDIINSLENYPVLDDEDFSRREYEDTVETIRNCYDYGLDFIDSLPEDWAEQVYSELSEVDGISCADELTEERVKEACQSLGFLNPEPTGDD